MGRIIIKIPEDVNEEVELILPYDEIKRMLETLKKKEKIEYLKRNFDKVKHKFKVPSIEEEELYE